MLSYILFFSLIFGFQCGLAMEMGQDELDQRLIDVVNSYYDPNQQATAVDRVGDLLSRGANPNILFARDGRTPLLHLLDMRDEHENRPIKIRLMELLLRAGANPNCMVNRGGDIYAPLSLSCSVENRAIFDLLVEHGADIHQRFENKKTLLHSAVRCWNLELCEFLLKNGFDVNALHDNGNTPLHFACGYDFARARNMQNNTQEVIELLLDWGAQINLQNNEGMTPLHLALAMNRSCAEIRPVVTVLLARGANLKLLCRWNVNRLIESPLELAAVARNRTTKREYKEHRRLCELIVAHQVLVNKGILTLLGSLRKMELEGDAAARTLYRHRAQLLRPYLRQLHIPLWRLLRRPARKMPSELVVFSGFQIYQNNLPNSNFNIDFLDIARIPQTYQRLNRNIYHGLSQPRIIGLTQSNPVLNDNNNNEGLIEVPLVEAPALALNNPDTYDDDSDDDDDNMWNIVHARRIAEQERDRLAAIANAPEEQPFAETSQLNARYSDSAIIAMAIGVWGTIGYIVYKCYTNSKKRIEKEKRKKKEGRNKKSTPSVTPAPGIVYA